MKKILSVVMVAMLATGLIGCSVMSGNRSVKTYADDAATTAAVKTNLARNDMVPASQITVNTDKNVVQLSGFVRTKAQADEAEKIALHTEGVKSVKNDIVTYQDAHGKSVTNRVKRHLTYKSK